MVANLVKHNLKERGLPIAKGRSAVANRSQTDAGSPNNRSDTPPTEISANRRWYVFRAITRHEGLAEANLTAQGFTHFLPKALVTRRHARRFVTERQWIFPRYGFVALDITRDRWRSVNGTIGIERLVMGDNGPQPVPIGIVEALQACVDDRGLFDIDDGLRLGSSVRVRHGIFTGTFGTLQSLDGAGRVELLLQWLNGQVRIKLDREWVEAVA